MNSSEKTATLLKLLGRAPYVHSVTELGEQISCSKSGTFKLLASLVKTGLAAQTPEHIHWDRRFMCWDVHMKTRLVYQRW